MEIKQVGSWTITYYLKPLLCHVTLGYSQHKGKGVRQGEGGVCPCVSTMAHAINDRTVIMSACSLMAFLVERPEEWGEDGLCGAERYTGKIECVTHTRCKKISPWSLKKKKVVKKEKLFATVGIYLCVHVCAERAGLRFLGRAEGCPRWFRSACSTIVICYPRSSHIYWIHINEALLLCV